MIRRILFCIAFLPIAIPALIIVFFCMIYAGIMWIVEPDEKRTMDLMMDPISSAMFDFLYWIKDGNKA